MPERTELARDRIARVFRFLQAFHQIKNPVPRVVTEAGWHLWLNEAPTTSVSWAAGISEADNEGEAGDEEDPNLILRVRRPTLKECPRPPAELDGWLVDGWRRPDLPVRVVESRPSVNEEGEETFHDSSARVEGLKHWQVLRSAWAKTEIPLRRADDLFQELYKLHGQLRRESERFELVLGDGILVWRDSGGDTNYPVLLQPLQLVFDPDVPEFRVTQIDRETELNSALLNTFRTVSGARIAECREEVVRGGIHPLAGAPTEGFLKRLALSLSGQGILVDGNTKPSAAEYPQIYRRPVLFLRTRAAGFARALETIISDVENGSELPFSLRRIVGVNADTTEGVGGGSRFAEADVLLSKEANLEQIQIVQRLEDHGSVLVQGPPGTGKSHTIANLIGHLLAHGQSVLVTSHTTKALGVLRDHVVEDLRPLCVSVLESDLESRRQLEDAVTSIADRRSRADERELEREVAQLESERTQVRQKLESARIALRDARHDEYRPVIVAGESWAPSDAARLVAAGSGTHEWIPGPLEAGEPLPATATELAALYESNAIVSAEDEALLAHPLPDLDSLVSPAHFDLLVRPVAAVPTQDRHEWWTREPHDCNPEELSEAGRRLQIAANQLAAAPAWQRAAASAAMAANGSDQPWKGLAARIDEAVAVEAASSELLMRFDAWLPEDGEADDHERLATEIVAHFETHGSLGLVARVSNRRWARFIKEARVSGAEPRTQEHFEALKATATLQRLRAEVKRRWSRLMQPGGAPSWEELGSRPETAAAQFSTEVRRALEWEARLVRPDVERLRQLGLRWDAFIDGLPAQHGDHAVLERLLRAIRTVAPILDGRIETALRSRRDHEMRRLLTALSSDCEADATLHASLAAAVETRNARLYRSLHERVSSLRRLLPAAQRRAELLRQVERVAPAWARALRSRTGAHGTDIIPGDVHAAWTWAQLDAELNRRASKSLPELQARVEALETELRGVTTRLIDSRAWLSQVRRTSLEQQQALVGWLDTIRHLGKGTGKRSATLRAHAAAQMKQCRTAVPVWIMPISRVAEMFDAGARFDVVIVDEASQSDVLGLVALYLGKKVVVVGDHEQVSPAAVGQQLDTIEKLIDEHLTGIPNAPLYVGKTSLYDLARESFGGLICLTEHFRCYPDIIEFSNRLSYGGRIKALREAGPNALTPFVVPHRVSGGERSEKVNRAEAAHAASLIISCALQPEYASKTFGAISLLGDHQAIEIDRLLREHMSEAEYVSRRILCGNAAHFQGDERDVVFLSVVHGSTGAPLPLQQTPMLQQRFNVAASRARDQMWVVYSVDPAIDLKPGDLRRRLIEHALDPSGFARELEHKSQRAESDFERRVLQRLVSLGYSVRPQHPVGAYRIDIVVESRNGARLAVECDGDRYHTLENLDSDMARQAVLERLGWKFVRIRGTEFYRNPDRALAPVFSRLAELGIEPSDARTPATRVTSDVHQRVLARAAELRSRWGFGVAGSDPALMNRAPAQFSDALVEAE